METVTGCVSVSRQILETYHEYNEADWQERLAQMRATGTMKSFDPNTGKPVDVNQAIKSNRRLRSVP